VWRRKTGEPAKCAKPARARKYLKINKCVCTVCNAFMTCKRYAYQKGEVVKRCPNRRGPMGERATPSSVGICMGITVYALLLAAIRVVALVPCSITGSGTWGHEVGAALDDSSTINARSRIYLPSLYFCSFSYAISWVVGISCD
jgi:hypothetical protein